MSLAKMTSKGQITVPKTVRDYLELHTGDKVEFIIDEKGRVIMTPKTLDVEDIFGMIEAHKKMSIDDMNKAIRKKIKERHGKHERDWY